MRYTLTKWCVLCAACTKKLFRFFCLPWTLIYYIVTISFGLAVKMLSFGLLEKSFSEMCKFPRHLVVNSYKIDSLTITCICAYLNSFLTGSIRTWSSSENELGLYLKWILLILILFVLFSLVVGAGTTCDWSRGTSWGSWR